MSKIHNNVIALHPAMTVIAKTQPVTKEITEQQRGIRELAARLREMRKRNEYVARS